MKEKPSMRKTLLAASVVTLVGWTGQSALAGNIDVRNVCLLARGDHPSVSANPTIEDLLKAEFVAPNRRREIGHLPHALREFYKLGFHEAVRVSELLEIPTVVANTDLLGIFLAGMGSVVERLGLRTLATPIELPALPIYMIWHDTRRNDAAHRWLREIVV
jgi:DNA-binding transcriptional LysR family regulator